MKTHRNILIISFFIGLITLPFLFLLNDGKTYEIMLALFTSSFISFLLELPNYFSLKKENDYKLYSSLFWAKSQASILINNIENIKSNNSSLFDKFYFQNVNDMNLNLNIVRSFDEDYYFSKSKNEKIVLLKNELYNSWQNVNLATLHFSVNFSQIRIKKTKDGKVDIVSAIEIENELDLIVESCKNFMKTIDKITLIIFTKKQLEKWNIDNIALENNKINTKVNKIS